MRHSSHFIQKYFLWSVAEVLKDSTLRIKAINNRMTKLCFFSCEYVHSIVIEVRWPSSSPDPSTTFISSTSSSCESLSSIPTCASLCLQLSTGWSPTFLRWILDGPLPVKGLCRASSRLCTFLSPNPGHWDMVSLSAFVTPAKLLKWDIKVLLSVLFIPLTFVNASANWEVYEVSVLPWISSGPFFS